MQILKKLLSLKITFLYNFELFYYIHEIVIQSSFNYTNTSGIHIKPEKSVVIAGGGLSGLALALALKSSGIEDILVIERAKALRSKSQGAIRLTKEGLNSLGIIYPSLPETLRSVGANFEKSIAKKALTNGTVTYIKGNDINQGTGILIAWADIQNSLANAINEISNDEYWLRCGSGIKSYNEKGDKVEVQLEDGSIITTSLLVGGDGTFSTIRRHIKAPLLDMPRSYSQTNWNAIIPRYSVQEKYRVPERTLHGVSYFISGACSSLYNVDIGRNRTFWQLRITDEEIAKAVDSTGRGGAGLNGVKERIMDIIDKASKDTPDTNFGELKV